MVRLPSGALSRTAAWGGSANGRGLLFHQVASPGQKASIGSRQWPQRAQLQNLEEAYNVAGVLGSGGFAIVRRASHHSGGPTCAVKTMPKGGARMEDIANNEAGILQSLSHPNICKLFHVCEDPGYIHLVMEHVNGHELFDEIAAQLPVNEFRAAWIMKQVFEALQYCHGLSPSVIHRDIKPENIMVISTSEDVVPDIKIIDWGLAIVCEDMVQTPVVGTASYLAPESLDEGIYSSASDMWGAGTVLHMMLTGGEVPYQFASAGGPDRSRMSLVEESGASHEAQDLLRVLLVGASFGRITAASASKHSWTLGHHSPPAVASVPHQENRGSAVTPVVTLSRDSLCRETHLVSSPLAVSNEVVGTYDQSASCVRNVVIPAELKVGNGQACTNLLDAKENIGQSGQQLLNVDNVVVPGHWSDKSAPRPVWASHSDIPFQDLTLMCADEDFEIFVDLPEDHPCSLVPGVKQTEGKQSWKTARECKENLGPAAFPYVTRSHTPSSRRQKLSHSKIGCTDVSLNSRRLLMR